ncbi:deoxyribose-phosphate aldolase [Prosthecobacter fusiformis]|uniref:Deoxyribose-phosphate aldolase n=1 Tax=Prosthecobacter fusiformis TaxID=48464 RepID=A0A4R7RMB1_9BACT|nr:deoxyribose-phosphate aldolase [Prosthecobacter fusiformis]TDU66504.1 deoxyribose-phosphate aldolase [Prosthecobacter fusiformis]
MKYSYAELAGMIDHALLQPGMTDAEAEAGCILAAKYGVASVCVKPCFIPRAVDLLGETGVIVGCVIGFPAGNSATEVKRYETQIACQEGAREIDMVINIGKALSGDWDYVEREIQIIADEAHKHDARLKVIFENDYLPKDETKIQLCEICGRAGADWVKTSTGYGFNKQPDGSYNYKGATEHDLRLMRQHSPAHVQVKASGGVRDLDGLILVRDLGCTRLGTSSTQAILDEYRRRERSGESGSLSADIGKGGY